MSAMLDPFRAPLFQAIGWALVHFLWQGVVLAVVFRAALGALRGARSTTRYAVACAGLLLMAAAPVATTVLLLRNPAPAAASAPWTAPPAASVPDYAAGPAPATPQVAASPAPRAGSGGIAALLERAEARVQPWVPLVALVWLAGVLLGAARLTGGWVHLLRLRTRWTCEVGESWTALFERLRREMGITRPVRLLGSMRIDVPSVAGALKPVVLVPASLLSGLSPKDVELILAHELAHVRRHDYLVNLLQAALETVLFFHPALWWLSGVVRDEREHCCDDAVVRASGLGRGYARALLAAEELRAAGAGPRLAMALGGGSLSRRIRRIVTPGQETPSAGAGPLGLAVAAMLVAVLAAGQGSLAAATLSTPKVAAAAPLPAAGQLADRWREARARAARAGWREYWIGWAVQGSESTAASGARGGVATGDTRSPFRDQLAPAGADRAMLGDVPRASEAVVLFRMAAGDTVPRAMQLGAAGIPAELASLPVAWLGVAPSGESLGLLGRLYPISDTRVREEVVAGAAVHPAGPEASGFVQRVLEGEESDRVRAEAAFWLQHQATPSALALLERVAVTDRSPRVREEAVTGIAHSRAPGAREALARLERTAPQLQARREAGDWLMRTAPR